MHSDFISHLQAPGQVVANLIDAVFPVGGAALVIYTIYSVGQSWFGAGQAVGALGFLSEWTRDKRATPGAVNAWKAVRPLSSRAGDGGLVSRPSRQGRPSDCLA